MSSFEKLYPYNALFENGNDTLTAWFVTIIIVFFLIQIFRLSLKLRSLSKKIRVLSKDLTEESMLKDDFFKSIWKDYKGTFIEFNGEQKTDEYAFNYFNENHLLSLKANINLIKSVPSTLVGIGILGTFVGLTYGISSFETSSTEAIKGSIEVLLSGMGTAFISSIWGMGTSITFTFLEKWRINSLHEKIHEFCYQLDKKYKITKEDERKMATARQREVLEDFFAFSDQNGNKVKPGNVLRDLYKESEKQSNALQSFSADLAELIEEGINRVLNDPTQGVVHELKILNEEIIKLGKKLQDPASEMTENVVHQLEKAMAEMIKEFKGSVSDSTKAEMEQLAATLSEAGGALTSFPEKIDQMGELLKEKIGSLQNGQESLIERQTENISTTESLFSSFNANLGVLNGITEKMNDMGSIFNKAHNEFRETSKNFMTVSSQLELNVNHLNKSQGDFSSFAENFLKQNNATIEKITTTLNHSGKLSKEYSEKFEVIEKGLKLVFKQIDEGLNTYRETVGQSLDSYLGKYTDALTKSTSSLSGTAERQEDLLEDLTELLSNLKN